MKKIYVSSNAGEPMKRHLLDRGYMPVMISGTPFVQKEISTHPDIYMCKMGTEDSSPVFRGIPEKLGCRYPEDIIYNAACTGKYFMHNLEYTDPSLLKTAVKMDMEPVNIPQGYGKCSIVVVDENSVITSDRGIYAAASAGGPECLLVSPGHIKLPGYRYGFIGGASGRAGREILFNGALNRHPDFEKICRFIRSRDLEPVWFPEYELEDTGSVITFEE